MSEVSIEAEGRYKKTAGYGLHMLWLSPVGGACEFFVLL